MREFQTTHWSLVIHASRKDESSRAAMESLCKIYWKPVYFYVCRRGYRSEDAKDLTQAFFVHVIEKDLLGQAREERGKFRHFLRKAIKNFLANEWDKGQAQKRGGTLQKVRLDGIDSSDLLGVSIDASMSPDALFDRMWAITLLGRVLDRLRAEWLSKGKEALFDALQPRLTRQALPQPYSEVAECFGMSETAVKLTALRMRRRYGEVLKEEVMQTLAGEGDFRQELLDLQSAIENGF